ncbi:MFS transporter [Methylobacterium sp. J-026]|jgi:ACS family tartrate transporter-like MFS transporter|uniref:MFS transporter n=1 Tax=unclassified Methylobacterium TaxID=2615210 RepID=UPI0011C8F506|nr:MULTISPECIES: MFS transporter [unclassified Methylobacterium]MCJ2136872.1 MFS transporter [Methylobacterium sp. J-026]TXM71137.1 MFS transporter [Methylobacterium sp. WL120]
MDASLERATMRRVAWRLVPFICLLYFIAFIDRVNIGFAALTMNKDLGFSSSVFGFGAGIFFFGYFLFEVPSNIVLDKVGARLWIARVMITWGMLSGAFAFIEGEKSFYALRFLLGAAEAGFFPGIILYLTYWFPARYRAGVVSLFMAAAPVSVLIGSPLSGALLAMEGVLGLHGWQWMFIIEAIPAVILGVVVLFYMTDRPEKAKWLTADQRTWLVAEMNEEHARKKVVASHGILAGMTDIRVLALALVYFGTSAGLYTLGIWAPQIIKSFGLSTMAVGFLNGVPPTIAIVAMILWARHSDRTGERTWHVVIACLVASAGLLLAGGAASAVTVVAALSLVNVGISAAKPPLWAMPTMFLSGSGAAVGIATINSVGNLGGFVGPWAIGWIKDLTGSFTGGLVFVAALLVLSAVVTLAVARSGRRAEPASAIAR